MLAIRLQRQGRKGYPVYRIIVQEAQRQPTSGRVVAYVGSYNPHTKEYQLDKAKIETYLKNGAQPTPRVVKLLMQEKVELPKWVALLETKAAGKTRFPDKLRKNRPAEEAPAEEKAEAAAEETPASDENATPAEAAEDAPAETAGKAE